MFKKTLKTMNEKELQEFDPEWPKTNYPNVTSPFKNHYRRIKKAYLRGELA